MQKVTDIKNRIKNISDTRKITGAMETIAIAKMQKAMAKYNSTQVFFDKILESINYIVRSTGDVENRYYAVNRNKPDIHIVISSDKGMAGAYNSNVLGHALEHLEQEEDTTVYAIGQSARNYFEKNNRKVNCEFVDASFGATKRDAVNISKHIIDLFLKGSVRNVFLTYTHLNENSTTNPTTIKLLPFCIDTAWKDEDKFNSDTSYELEYEPSAEEVLDALVPKYLHWVTYGALTLSVASEHFCRRQAMSSATKNADDILGELKIKYNQARQESITNELNEIITTTQGVSSNGGGK